jgi:hypothetical protein
MKHRHHDLIVAWADDKTLEFEMLLSDGSWVHCVKPVLFSESVDYRIQGAPITNKRISELAIEAGFDPFEVQQGFFQEKFRKFADLIVNEK